ncbi:receptor-type tyrosine-protein phosphatase eta-like [Symphorus nematophorus]
MKPLLRLSVSLLTLLVFSALLKYEITVTAVAGDNTNEGQSSAVIRYTKPGQIGNRNVSTNTSSISLNWKPPPGEVSMYRVEWDNGGALMIRYTNDAFAVLSDLIPGTSYTIKIIAVAGDNTTGEPCTFSSVTKPAVVRGLNITDVTTSKVSLDWTEPEEPEKAKDIKVTTRGTDYLNINWASPNGGGVRYVVNITNVELSYINNSITSDTTANLTGLNPARIYNITVTTVAGNFMVTSGPSSFATFPTSPDSINISQRTNSSLHLNWATPALVDGAPQISYYITYQPKDGQLQNDTATVNKIRLSQLSSGTFYNITVETVGQENLRSTAVHNSAFTLPNPVLNLTAHPKSTTSVEVTWSDPQGALPYYTYLVQTYNTTGAVSDTTVNITSTDVANLEPGTRYNISVTTIAAEGSESTVEQTFSYTMPKVVTDLRVNYVNTTVIQLTWQRQSDYKPSYSYLVKAFQDDMLVQNGSTEAEIYTFFNLIPGKNYTFEVFAVVGGVKSAVGSISIYTNPAAVFDITVMGNTTDVSVSWEPALGQVDSYTVLLYRDSQLVGSKTDLSNTTVSSLFLAQIPGVLYCAVVVTKSGPLESNSSRVCNATLPNPPGPIMVESQTVKSINFTWPLPAGMDHQLYNFTVSSFKGTSLTGNNWFLLDSLESGSPYNISVVTVGVLNFESTEVTAENYTRPYSVIKLREAEITTDAVTLVWDQREVKPHYSYLVQTSNGSIFKYETVNNTTHTIRELLSGSNYSFTVTTQTADGTQAEHVTVSYFTRPYSVSQLEAETLNSTAVRLTWMKPPEYKDEYTYRVQTTGCNKTKNETFSREDVQISELTPGMNCSLCVFVRAADGIEGAAECTSQFTKPESVQAKISSQGSNSSILVSWTPPPGRVEFYEVRLNGTSTLSERLGPASTSSLFEGLLAGRLYTAVVTTFSGQFNASSGSTTNATFPNPPGPIEILKKTQSSIDIRWRIPAIMTGASFQYRLKISQGGEEYVPGTNTKHTFESLLSGTSYNISIETVGVMGFVSEKVQIDKVTTRPFSVVKLDASPEEECITVMWDKPDQHKESYRYNLTWQNSDGTRSVVIRDTQYKIHDLIPGSPYNLSVTTETSDGTEGAPIWISRCTMPSIPADYESLLMVTEREHNKFSIKIDSDLLDSTNGPITAVGVLVTNTPSAITSNLTKYLGNTYSQWKAGKTPVYLATARETSLQSRSEQNHLIMQVGDESTWEGYTNGALDANREYQYAIVLFTKLSLENNLVVETVSLVSITNFYPPVKLPANPVVIAIAVGVTLGIFCVLFIILIGFIIYWKRLSNKEASDIQIHSLRSVAVRVEDYEAYYRKQKADSNCGFAEEFEDLKLVGTGQSKTNALHLENKPKNRYNNVLPYDSSRVKLSIIHGSPYDDYINANYMPGYNSRKEFIAAQGPLPATVNEFWRMIWEKNVQTLVMLTRCNEQGRVKCEQYWDSGTKHFENITVTATSEIRLDDWTIREFDVKNVKTAETRSVRHFHFTAWPDHGVPETTELLISFRHLVREHMDQYSRHSPTVVHCSAGVGRTGTFIAIDRLIFQIERENIVDVYGIVHDLRMHRPLMVQTEDQYVFLNQCAMDIIRSRTGTNVDLIYQNTAALSIYENVEPKKGYPKNGYHNA